MRSGLQWKASVDVYLSSLTTVKIIVIIVGKSQINSTKQPHHSNLHVQKLRRDHFFAINRAIHLHFIFCSSWSELFRFLNERTTKVAQKWRLIFVLSGKAQSNALEDLISTYNPPSSFISQEKVTDTRII